MTRTQNLPTVIGLATLFSLGMYGAPATLAASSTPIAITPSSFNSDTIQDSSSDLSSKPFEAYAGFSLYSPAVTATGSIPTTVITSVSNSSTTFQFAPATGPNAALLSTNGTIHGGSYSGVNYTAGSNTYVTSDTLVLATPAKYSGLSFLSAATNANGTLGSTLSYTVNYVGTTTTTTGTFSAKDWGGSSGDAFAYGYSPVAGEIVQTTPVTSGRYMFETDVTGLSTAFPVASITFTDTNDNASGAAVAGVFAVSGIAVAPEPGETAAMLMGGLTLLGLIARKRRVHA
jgi:hypothetical protein